MLKAVETVSGHSFQYNVRDFAGYTDRLIMRRLLERAGVPAEQVEEKLKQAETLYLQWIADRFQDPHFVQILPGVKPLLEKLTETNHFYLGLLTGNLREGARIKLGAVGLFHYFPIGAFGDDAEERLELPPIALERAHRHFGVQFAPQEVWIIGDAPNDIRCARANQLRSLIVATGVVPVEELKSEKPDVLLPDLSRTEEVMAILAS